MVFGRRVKSKANYGMEDGGNRGWYLSVSDEGTCLSGVRQLALALLTLSREG